jgi:hypothetical protein
VRIAPIIDDAHFVRVYGQMKQFEDARMMLQKGPRDPKIDELLWQAQVDSTTSVIDEMREALDDYVNPCGSRVLSSQH